MRNVDKIKQLQHELGRYEKKVADQAKEIARLQEREAELGRAITEISRQANAFRIRLALKYGVEVRQEESGDLLGWRLTLDKYDITETLNEFETKMSWDATGEGYTIGVWAKEQA